MEYRVDRRTLIGGMAALTLSACTKSAHKPSGQASGQPNVVFIMADDLGYADLGCTGSRHIQTPHIDSLAENGLFFTQGYANSAICSPTRTALLSGRYQYRFKIGLEEPLRSSTAAQEDLGLPLQQATLASVFKDIGYNTALIGKWHLGLPPKYNPLEFGYDTYFGITGGAADYFRHRSVREGQERGLGLFKDNEEIKRVGYLTDLLGEETDKFIREADDRPLFVSLHFTAPHWPWEGREDEEVARLLKDYFHYDGGSLGTYANMVSAMDENIGQVLQALKETGRLDNTIIVFTSDNGGERFSDTWPFVGTKGELLEGGIRVPLLIQWPDRIKAGVKTDQVITSMDFLPTLLAMAGGETSGLDVDGLDLSLQILDGTKPVDRTLFWRFKASEQAAVRDGDWKYLKLGSKEHLFNVAKDPRERAQLKELHPDIFERLRAKYDTWNADMLPYGKDSYSEKVHKNYPDRY